MLYRRHEKFNRITLTVSPLCDCYKHMGEAPAVKGFLHLK